MSFYTPKKDDANSDALMNKMHMMNLLDPRSPTFGIERTPLQVLYESSSSCSISDSFVVEELSESQEEESNDDSNFMTADEMGDSVSDELEDADASYTGNLIETSDTQLAVAADTEPKLKNHGFKPIPKQVQKLKLECTPPSRMFNVYSDDDNAEAIPCLKRQNFLTPDGKLQRSPLTKVENICPNTPPAIKDCSWKSMNVERRRLGFEENDNFPSPMHDVTSSAPGKFGMKKHRSRNIDQIENM